MAGDDLQVPEAEASETVANGASNSASKEASFLPETAPIAAYSAENKPAEKRNPRLHSLQVSDMPPTAFMPSKLLGKAHQAFPSVPLSKQNIFSSPQVQLSTEHGNMPPMHAELLNSFWQNQLEQLATGALSFKDYQLPLARIKKIMRIEEGVKACELFILELTLRSWMLTEEERRRTLQRSDVETAISRCDMYDFLVDIVVQQTQQSNDEDTDDEDAE